MSDEQGTPVTGDSPTEADVNWEQRFKDTQAAYTQSQQRLKELEDSHVDWDDEDAVWQRASEKFGWNTADDEPDEPEVQDEESYVPDVPPHDPRLDEQLPRIDAAVQWVAQQQFDRDLNQFVGDRELSQEGREFVEALWARSRGQNPSYEQDAKALEGAVQKWFGVFPEEKKPRPKAPHVPAKGSPVADGKPWSELTPAERLERQLERAAEFESQT